MGLAIVARVDELVLPLVMQFVQHGHGRIFGAAERREFVMPLAGHRQERVAAVHQVAIYERIRILDRLKFGKKCQQKSRRNSEISRFEIESAIFFWKSAPLTAKLAALCAECNRMTKKTSLCLPMVSNIFSDRLFPVEREFDFLLFDFLWLAFDLFDFFFCPFFLPSAPTSLSSWSE